MDDDLEEHQDFYNETTNPVEFVTPRKTSLVLDN